MLQKSLMAFPPISYMDKLKRWIDFMKKKMANKLAPHCYLPDSCVSLRLNGAVVLEAKLLLLHEMPCHQPQFHLLWLRNKLNLLFNVCDFICIFINAIYLRDFFFHFQFYCLTFQISIGKRALNWRPQFFYWPEAHRHVTLQKPFTLWSPLFVRPCVKDILSASATVRTTWDNSYENTSVNYKIFYLCRV